MITICLFCSYFTKETKQKLKVKNGLRKDFELQIKHIVQNKNSGMLYKVLLLWWRVSPEWLTLKKYCFPVFDSCIFVIPVITKVLVISSDCLSE